MSNRQYFVGLVITVAVLGFAVMQVSADHDYQKKQLLLDLQFRGIPDSTIIYLATLPRKNGVNQKTATQSQDE